LPDFATDYQVFEAVNIIWLTPTDAAAPPFRLHFRHDFLLSSMAFTASSAPILDAFLLFIFFLRCHFACHYFSQPS
jgi:hypothetical protein